ncbi:hypothetical protein [Caballeronia glebae]|uniref:hypothetical protein n=1 Tax=Caballeronia glebae TaxID=1777143 RepID=UPI0038B8D561
MPRLLAYYWRMLSFRLAPSSGRRLPPEAGCPTSACACATPRGEGEGEASRAERLEYIALFAQAGYFNMGNAVDLFQPPVEPPPF